LLLEMSSRSLVLPNFGLDAERFVTVSFWHGPQGLAAFVAEGPWIDQLIE
jgi:hypothetical protein